MGNSSQRVAWPARSPELNVMDFYLWAILKVFCILDYLTY
jgi:hypothetical protein